MQTIASKNSSTNMPPLMIGGPLHREWRVRAKELQRGFGISIAEAEVLAAKDLGLLPIALPHRPHRARA